jgi:hypothetical protein
MIVEVIVIRKCPHCGNEHPGLTLRETASAVTINGKNYTYYTYCPEMLKRIYLNMDFPLKSS